MFFVRPKFINPNFSVAGMEPQRVHVFTASAFRKWLAKNHEKENKVFLIIHKRHTGKKFPTHRELMDEAICYGWIDTIIKRIDHDTFSRCFMKRTDKANWSNNTMSYAKLLVENGRMTPAGMKSYKEGLQRKTIDHDMPKDMPPDKVLIDALKKVKGLPEKFEGLSKSTKSMLIRWVARAKMPETKQKRIAKVVAICKKQNRMQWTDLVGKNKGTK